MMDDTVYRCEKTTDLEDLIMKSIDDVIEASELTYTGISNKFDVPLSTLYGCRRGKTPKTRENVEKMEAIMDYTGKKTERHPSFWYATKEEIESLMVLQGKEKENLLKKIKKRTALNGKIK